MDRLFIPSSFDAYTSGTTVKKQVDEERGIKKFNDLMSKAMTAQDRTPFFQEAAKIDPVKTMQFSKYFQEQDASAKGAKSEQERQNALMTLRKLEVLETSRPESMVQMYRQAAPEDYAAYVQAMGREPTQQEIMEAAQMYKAELSVRAGLEQGGGNAVHSTFIGDDGQMYIVPRNSMKPVNTGIAATKFAPRVVDIAGGKSVVDLRTQQPTATLSTPEQERQAAAAKAGAQTAAQEAAKTAAIEPRQAVESRLAAAQDLPKIESSADQMIDVLEQLDNSNLGLIFGAGSVVPIIPGTAQANAHALWEQAQGKVFMEAFQTLKGGGPITDTEGQKATAAMTRLANRKQSPEAARKAIRELREVTIAVTERARRKARMEQGSQQQQQGQPTKTATGPNGEKIGLINGQWVPLNGQ